MKLILLIYKKISSNLYRVKDKKYDLFYKILNYHLNICLILKISNFIKLQKFFILVYYK